MYIVKPQKGFVIPVEYMSNDKLYSGNRNYLRQEAEEKNKDIINKNNNSIFKENEKIEVESDYKGSRSRLIDEYDDTYSDDYNNVITTILEEKTDEEESGSGILIFDDASKNDSIEIDEIKSLSLDKARGNLRKAIEVEIEKVGKLVLDDSEINLNSNLSVKSAEADTDDINAEKLEGNIVTDETRKEDKYESVAEIILSKDTESEASEESSETDKLS